MDEPKTRPGFPGDRSQAAAEKLRALRERANHALDEHRSRLGEIETQLSDRVRQLAEEFGATLGAAKAGEASREDEIAALRRQVEEGHAKHDKFVEQLIAAREQLDALESRPCEICQQAAQQLAAADEEMRRLREQLEASTREHEEDRVRHEEDRVRHEKFVEQLAAARQAITVLQHAAGESTAELRGEMEELREDKLAAETQLATALRDLEAVHDECDAALARATAFESELAEVRLELGQMREQAATLDRDRGEAVGETEQLREQLAAVEAQLAQMERDRDEQARANLDAEGEKQALEASLADARRALDTLQASSQAEQSGLVEMLAAADAETQAAEQKRSASESEKLTLSLALSQAESVSHEFQNRVKSLEQELESLRSQAAMSTEVPELRGQLEKAQAAAAERMKTVAELKEMLEDARGELAALRDSMVSKGDLEAARRDCQAAQKAIDELTTAVASSQAQIKQSQTEADKAQADAEQARAETAELRESTRPSAEFAELQQKFDLALADVQKLKREASALRDELAARPAASDQESPELIAARSERDALAARVSELEAAAAASAAAVTVDADAQQERDDLQRRFEMAVDDVRQLKQENAQLREKLASAGKGHGDDDGGGASGGSDWASQRARLMAMLQEEDDTGDISPERTAERATVSKTIAATDRVIENKEREIAELRAELEMRDVSGMDHEAAAARDQVLDADELIAAERQRLAKLTAEWEEKLRAAELEFSVERAKLGREQAALRDRALELQSAAAQGGVMDHGDPTKPKRRWLSALGLHDEEEGKKKK